MTVDADATPARGARRGRSPFELLRFTATPVPGALVVVEIEGRVAAASGRFSRRPVLVVEADAGADRPRLELAPSRTALDGDRWRATYAIPAESYDAARFALGLRGTLLDLPNPDEPSDADRLALLSREANALRRELEAAEADAASARAEATAAAGELGAAVSAARDEALAAHEAALADLKAEHDRAATEAEERHAAALAEAEERCRTAIAEAEASDESAERRRIAAEEGIAVLRAELVEERERARALEEELTATNERLETLRRAAEDDDEDATRVLAPVAEEDDDTAPFTIRDERAGAGEPRLPLERGTPPRRTTRRGPGAYVAVAALALFIVILLGLVLGVLS